MYVYISLYIYIYICIRRWGPPATTPVVSFANRSRLPPLQRVWPGPAHFAGAGSAPSTPTEPHRPYLLGREAPAGKSYLWAMPLGGKGSTPAGKINGSEDWSERMPYDSEGWSAQKRPTRPHSEPTRIIGQIGKDTIWYMVHILAIEAETNWSEQLQ